jgi:endoglycosylceramidase
MKTDLATFWQAAAKELVGAGGILGYEIMNEPFAGDYYADPTIMVPGVAGARNLEPMHDMVADAIRKNDNETIIFYEPVTWGMVFDQKAVGSGFTHVPGGAAYKDRAAFSFHYYCSTFVPGWQNKPVVRREVCDAAVAPQVLKAVADDIEHLGGAAMMTEGLACNGPNASGYDECVVVMSHLDKALMSWTDYGDSQGQLWAPSPLQQAAWARTYARAIAGTPINMTFGATEPTRPFELCFVLNRTVTAPTEIFASLKYNYPKGVAATTTSNLVASQPGSSNVWVVTPAGPSPPSGTDEVGCVRLRSK